MRVYHDVKEIKENRGIVLALGNFDGIHLGHQALIKQCVELADQLQAVPTIFTFQKHPTHITQDQEVEQLTPFKEKVALMDSFGIEMLIAIEFTPEFSQLSKEEFVDWVKQSMNVVGICVGENFRFGRGREGGVSELKAICATHGIEVRSVQEFRMNGEVISSTLIREALKEHRLDRVEMFLGRPLVLRGEVIHGRAIGSSVLGFATANLDIQNKLLPSRGVFGVKVWREAEQRYYDGVMNIGKNPTVSNFQHDVVEIHLLNFQGSLYGEFLTVEVVCSIRKEKKFNSLEALKAQIQEDVNNFMKSMKK